MAPLGPERIAIFPWGDVVEEFLDPLGLTPQDYAGRMRGGWLFGYVAALKAVGVESIIVHASESVAQITWLEHAETGAPIILAPGRRSGGGWTAGRPSRRALAQWARTPMRAFAEVLRAEGCTGVLVQDYEHARFDALALLAAALRLPLYASFQGGDVTLSRLEARVRGRTLRRCRGLAVASARERARLARTYGLGATVQDIPNPVDAAYWRAEPRAVARVELGVPADEVLFFNHGRIDIHRKGLDVLVEAWREVARRSRARLVIVGSGQDRDQFQVLLQGASGVTWIPDYVTDPPLIRRWLSAADVYVTLSRIEGMPVAPLEAMACGLPVIAADAHGLVDLAAEGGVVLVPREQAESAAEAMLQLAADPSLRQRLGRAARATIEARYSIPTVGARLSMLARTERASRRP